MTPFRTPWNYQPEVPVISTLPSMTEPDQSLSIKDCLTRFAQGKPITKTRKAVYTGDNYTPDLRKMDLTEMHELAAENRGAIRKLKQELTIQEQKLLARKAKLAADLSKLDALGGTKDDDKGQAI